MKKLTVILFALLLTVAYAEGPMNTCTVNGYTFQYPEELTLSETTVGIWLESEATGFHGQISEGLVSWPNAEAVLKKNEINQIQSTVVNGVQIMAGLFKSDFDDSTTRAYVLSADGKDALYISFKWKRGDHLALADQIVYSVTYAR